jgi:hypothetical protein
MRNAEFQRLERDYGIILPEATDFLKEGISHDYELAMDAQPGLVTVSNAGIPSYMTNFVDPNFIRAVYAPNKAAEILGEAKKGDWTDLSATFPFIENTGEASSYGDYSENGSVGMNATFPQRQSYHYQTITQWGERQLDMYAKARINYVTELNTSSVVILNKFQNNTYFFGVGGLQCYGLLNDPGLSAVLTPGVKAFGGGTGHTWVTGGVVTATANEVYLDIQTMFTELVAQSGGVIEMTDELVLAMSPTSAVALTALTTFNVDVRDQLKKNFPNLKVVTAVQYATTGGQLVQMIAPRFDGKQTGTCAYTEKLRAHPIVRKMSSFEQKKSQGTWGTIIWYPVAITSTLGV